MSPTAQLTAFAQSIYLAIKNRYFDDIEGEDGQIFVSQIIDWTNQYLDELENITNSNGELVDWNWLRQPNYELGTASIDEDTIELPREVQTLIADERRRVQILDEDGKVISSWAVVTPDQLNSNKGKHTELMVVRYGLNLQFSRPFKEDEDGMTIVGDSDISLPRLSRTNVKVLSIVKPKQLLILGVGKNATLPDIVQGGLSPSYVQKYNDLLQSAIARNSSSSLGDTIERENFSYIHGVGF
jgi:hypothetical protein